MRKILLLLAGIALLTACEKEPNVAPNVEETEQMTALDRYLQRVAEEGIAMLGDTPTRAGVRRAIDPTRTRAFVKATTRSEEDTLFYVVNFADSTGFALVEADTTSPTPLIAVTEQGNYSPGEVTNTGFDLYMDMLSQNSTRKYERIPIDTTKVGRMYGELDKGPEIMVEPLLEVEWGQHNPYNTFCYDETSGYKSVAGCVPIAIAQIMSYYEYPTELDLRHPYRGELESLTLNWEQIKYHIKTDTAIPIYGCFCADHTHLTHLTREIGQRVQTVYYNYLCNYPNDGDRYISGNTYESTIIPGIMSLGYDVSSFVPYSREGVHAELDLSHPVYCQGLIYGTNSGHAWVVDGYHYQRRIMRTYQEGVGNMLPILLSEEDWSYDWLHINWGWDGDCNGYYKSGVFECTTSDNNSYNFSYNVHILPNFIPSQQ